ncbi:hypothetical protein QE152_g18075 [Popillia japonica]|uniref:Uncharacterized protein n=1 Tax=Popillia japonica TaxID=7064 RepID=A0AAW1L4Q7_POPJA
MGLPKFSDDDVCYELRRIVLSIDGSDKCRKCGKTLEFTFTVLAIALRDRGSTLELAGSPPAISGGHMRTPMRVPLLLNDDVTGRPKTGVEKRRTGVRTERTCLFFLKREITSGGKTACNLLTIHPLVTRQIKNMILFGYHSLSPAPYTLSTRDSAGVWGSARKRRES